MNLDGWKIIKFGRVYCAAHGNRMENFEMHGIQTPPAVPLNTVFITPPDNPAAAHPPYNQL